MPGSLRSIVPKFNGSEAFLVKRLKSVGLSQLWRGHIWNDKFHIVPCSMMLNNALLGLSGSIGISAIHLSQGPGDVVSTAAKAQVLLQSLSTGISLYRVFCDFPHPFHHLHQTPSLKSTHTAHMCGGPKNWLTKFSSLYSWGTKVPRGPNNSKSS